MDFPSSTDRSRSTCLELVATANLSPSSGQQLSQSLACGKVGARCGDANENDGASVLAHLFGHDFSTTQAETHVASFGRRGRADARTILGFFGKGDAVLSEGFPDRLQNMAAPACDPATYHHAPYKWRESKRFPFLPARIACSDGLRSSSFGSTLSSIE